jgi:hypothetical protein
MASLRLNNRALSLAGKQADEGSLDNREKRDGLRGLFPPFLLRSPRAVSCLRYSWADGAWWLDMKQPNASRSSCSDWALSPSVQNGGR